MRSAASGRPRAVALGEIGPAAHFRLLANSMTPILGVLAGSARGLGEISPAFLAPMKPWPGTSGPRTGASTVGREG